jgi:hypothetical protein
MKDLFKLFFIAVILSVILLILYYDNKNSDKIVMEINKGYNSEISGIVSSISQNRGVIKLRLRKKVNYPFYLEMSRNYNLDPIDIDIFIRPGDSVFKTKSSKELFVFRDGFKYEFLLGKTIY